MTIGNARRGGLYTVNGRGFLAHALEAKLSPLKWVFFALPPAGEGPELQPGDFVSWTAASGETAHGWIANFIPEDGGCFRLRVLAVPAHLRVEAVRQACGDPITIFGLLPSKTGSE